MSKLSLILFLFGLGCNLLMIIIPKTPSWIITVLVCSFFLWIYPIWNLPFIEKSLWLRIAALFFAACVLCIIGFTVSPDVTPEAKRVETNVKNWLENFHYNIQKQPSDTAYFKYEITMPNKNKIYIERFKHKSDYLRLSAGLKPIKEEQDLLNKLTKRQKDELITQLNIEAARRINIFTFNPEDYSFVFERNLPISSELTENMLKDAIDQMDGTLWILRNTVSKTFIQYKLL